MGETTLKTRLVWQCRRGMLELDVILIPFLEKHFEHLSTSLQWAFSDLLKEADPDLYTWLMGYEECPIESLQDIVKLIVSKVQVGNLIKK